MIRYLNKNDFNAIERLAIQAEPLFGKMVAEKDFNDRINHSINQNLLFGYEKDGDISGAILIDKENNEISWFVVDEKSRGFGIGTSLLEYAISKLDNEKSIYVQTFNESCSEGVAARMLYLKFGFINERSGGKNPAGIETVIMKLKR